jgi:hypothetical protein
VRRDEARKARGKPGPRNKPINARTYLDGATGDTVDTVLEVLITAKGPTKWEWLVCDRHDSTIMGGFERSRLAARYRGYRALFLLLASSCIPREGRRAALRPRPT